MFKILLILSLISNTVALPALQRNENVIQNDESALNKLLANFKNFNASNLFASFRLPPCVQDCVKEMGSTIASLNFEERLSLEKTKETCTQFKALKKCVQAKPHCTSMIMEIGMHAFSYLCSDDEANTGLIPCIRRETLKIHATCERACRLGATLMDAATLNTKPAEVLNFLDEHGNKILSVPDLHLLCNTSTCFLSCMRVGIEEKCPNGGSAFVDNIMTSLMREMTSNSFLPETKVVDAYASLISSFLPRQCQNLILADKNIILTTPGAPFTFVTTAHYEAFAPTQKPVENTLDKNAVPSNEVQQEVNRNLKDDETENKITGVDKQEGSSSRAISSTLPVIMVLVALSHQ